MEDNSKALRIRWSKLRIILFGICGGIVSMGIVSVASLPGSFGSRIIHGLVSGGVISCGLVSGIVLSIGLTQQKNTVIKTLIILISATIGGVIGHLIYAIIISISVITLGAPLKGVLSGIVSITSNGIIFSLGISCGLIFARIISKNKNHILRILTIAIGGLVGNIAVELSHLLYYGKINILHTIFGLIVGLSIAFAEKEEIIM